MEVEFGRLGSKPPVKRSAFERERQSDVAVADEDERLLGCKEGARRRLRGEDVFPDGVAWARVVKADAVVLS